MPLPILSLRRTSLLPFLAAVPLLGGCSDMLGLGDLKFEHAAEPAATGGATSSSQGDGDIIGDGDSIRYDEPIDKVDQLFPITDWGSDAILVSAQAPGTRSRYFRYEPSSHVLYTHEIEQKSTDAVAQVWESDDPHSFTHVVSLRHGQQDVLIGYDSPTGWKETVTGIATQEQLSIAPQAVNAGYTHFITARWQNDWFVVAYNSETGSFSWVPAVAELDELSVPVTNGFGTWATGYTHMQAYTAGGHDGVLLFQPGRLRFMAFPSESALGLGGAGGSDLGMQQIASFDLAALREAGLLAADPTAVSVADFEGTPSLLFYDEVSGIVDLKQIVLQDEAFQVVSVDRGEQVATTSDGSAGKWRWQLTSLTFVSLNSDLGCITFDGELAEFRLFGDTPVVVVR